MRTAGNPFTGEGCNEEADNDRKGGHASAKQQAKVCGDDDCVPRTGDEAGQPAVQSNRGRRPEQQGGEAADPDAREQGNRKRPAGGPGWSEHEPVHAGVEIAELPQLLTQLVDCDPGPVRSPPDLHEPQTRVSLGRRPCGFCACDLHR